MAREISALLPYTSRCMRATAVAALFCLLSGSGALAQTPSTPDAAIQPPRPAVTATLPPPPVAAADLTVGNRIITTFRADVGTRSPADRARAATTLIAAQARAGVTGPVGSQSLQGATIVTLGSENAFVLLPQDADDLAGETLASISGHAVDQLRVALAELDELHKPAVMIRAAVLASLGSLVAAILFGLVYLGHRRTSARLMARVEDQLARYQLGAKTQPRMTPVFRVLRGVIRAITLVLASLIGYTWLTFVLNRFPYTRPWGEGLRGFLLSRLELLGLSTIHALPGLFTVAVIVLVTRFLIYCLKVLFDSVERGQVELPFVDAELARPTGHIVATLAWVFCIVVAYPYIPGSSTDAFKGVSVFVGLIVSLGSSGLVNQLMSGFVITYSRSVRVGEFARIADIEGTVTNVGVLATTVRTPDGEEMNIPNAVVVSHVVTNYSRPGERRAVWVRTSVTIGYDTPWRQVHALLLEAAAKTSGLADNPAPEVRQTALQDYYVEYTLLAAPLEARNRGPVFAELHARIQDAFNEHGVQIMSPHYMADPSAPKVVPKDKWFEPPAGRD